VYLPAITGLVPDDVVRCLRAFLDFCYIVRRNAIDEPAIKEVEDAIARFHHYRQVFVDAGVRADGISLPRQHSIIHYPAGIRLFGALNGLCSSITESKHIEAVKEPWRRSNRCNALGQMLTTNQRMDKMRSIRTIFERRGMLEGTTLLYTACILAGEKPVPRNQTVTLPNHDELEDGPVPGLPDISAVVISSRTGALYVFVLWETLSSYPTSSIERKYPKTVQALARHTGQPKLGELIRRFLYDQLNPNAISAGHEVSLEQCPELAIGKISVHHSATAYYYAPSDLCGVGGMSRQLIHSCPLWQREHPRRDTVLVSTDPDKPGMAGMVVARVQLFFSFKYGGNVYPCALVNWFHTIDDKPDDLTGMWRVKPEYSGNGRPSQAVIHVDCILRGVHLMGIYGNAFLPEDFRHIFTLDACRAFYINNFIDYHCNEIIK
jgi:hypothetical protein